MTQWRVMQDHRNHNEGVLSDWFTYEPAANRALALARKFFPEARLERREVPGPEVVP